MSNEPNPLGIKCLLSCSLTICCARLRSPTLASACAEMCRGATRASVQTSFRRADGVLQVIQVVFAPLAVGPLHVEDAEAVEDRSSLLGTLWQGGRGRLPVHRKR